MLGKPPLQILLSDWIDIGDVITLCFLVLKCLHQFTCSSYQKQGSPSMIKERKTTQKAFGDSAKN